MSALLPRLARPPEGAALGRGWFDPLGAWLLGRAALVAGGQRFRPLELEFYLHAPGHEDPFAHRHPVQREVGTWYLHRAGDSYRGGSFKGLDLTFGEMGYGGVLIRTLEGPAGVVNGSSLCVDALLAATGFAQVSALGEVLAGRSVEDPASPLRLELLAPQEAPVLRSARVGLTLKRQAEHPEMPAWIHRRYRCLKAPGSIPKGRDLLARALHEDGHGVEEIAARLGTRPAAVRRWVTSA